MKTKDNAELKRKKRHNQIKGLIALGTVLTLLLFGHFFLSALSLLIFFILNEVLWSDHIFYDRHSDYLYSFNGDNTLPCTLESNQLCFDKQKILCTQNKFEDSSAVTSTVTQSRYTTLLKLPIQSTLSGRIFDPYISISVHSNNERHKQQSQYFERNLKGQRYINISDFCEAIESDTAIQVIFHHCKPMSPEGEIIQFQHDDYTQKKIMVLAPHADDAELAAFGLYSQSNSHIITITAGEVEMEDYLRFYPSSKKSTPDTSVSTIAEQASRLKGRLRAWDSLAIPLWGNTPANHCIQLGYFCLTLKEMHETPDQPVSSRTAKTNSTAIFRQSNSQELQSDRDNKATWNNLTQDLQELIEDIKPDVIVTPHPQLDPHQDHYYTTKAIAEALPTDSPITLLYYANHYRTTDHFAFGPANSSVGLPPNFTTQTFSPQVVSVPLSNDTQIDKALSLAMMHDLQSTPSFKKRVRRKLQYWLCNRDHYRYGDNDFYSKTVNQQEVFFSSSVVALHHLLNETPGSHS